MPTLSKFDNLHPYYYLITHHDEFSIDWTIKVWYMFSEKVWYIKEESYIVYNP